MLRNINMIYIFLTWLPDLCLDYMGMLLIGKVSPDNRGGLLQFASMFIIEVLIYFSHCCFPKWTILSSIILYNMVNCIFNLSVPLWSCPPRSICCRLENEIRQTERSQTLLKSDTKWQVKESRIPACILAHVGVYTWAIFEGTCNRDHLSPPMVLNDPSISL